MNGPLVTVYESGSFHVSGTESVEEAEAAVEWFVESLEALGVPDVEPQYEVKNVVVVGDLERSVDLNKLAVLFGFECVEYEPEQFPGLVFRSEGLPYVYLIFCLVLPSTDDGFSRSLGDSPSH